MPMSTPYSRWLVARLIDSRHLTVTVVVPADSAPSWPVPLMMVVSVCSSNASSRVKGGTLVSWAGRGLVRTEPCTIARKRIWSLFMDHLGLETLMFSRARRRTGSDAPDESHHQCKAAEPRRV